MALTSFFDKIVPQCTEFLLRRKGMLDMIFKSFLFYKGILVGNKTDKDVAESIFALANLFNVEITSGFQYASPNLIKFVATMLDEYVPEPFYKGFPYTVKKLSKNELLFDQFIHYFKSYVINERFESGHSIFEEKITRLPFKEKTATKKFAIVSENEANEIILNLVEDMLKSTRPLNLKQYHVVKNYITKYNYKVEKCACKDTAINLLIDTKELSLIKFLSLSDVIKVVDKINYEFYANENIKKLNFKNQHRKLISKIINTLFKEGNCNIKDCFEKKDIWCGLLHHIHFQPKTPNARKFVNLIRKKGNISVYSEFERLLNSGNVKKAVDCLVDGKGDGALLRKFNYVISKCNDSEIRYVMKKIKSKNAIILIQLMMQYANYVPNAVRYFKFTKYNKLKSHKETPLEQSKRQSNLSCETAKKIYRKTTNLLKKLLYGKLGKVYICDKAYNVALPLQENTANYGYGVLSKGSQIHIGKDKKIRAFTYWEGVDDVDLSIIGITENGEQIEFSWRSMFNNQSNEITYSGDQVSGFNGASEYFDVDIALFRKKHPEISYLVFCNNVYSMMHFNEFLCKAGYMLRDINDSGEVFEPKTVESSFIVNSNTTFVYLFGIDLRKGDFVWLNASRNSDAHIAGNTSVSFIIDYFNITNVMNVGKLFEMLATEVVNSEKDADVIVAENDITINKNAQLIKVADFEKIMALIS